MKTIILSLFILLLVIGCQKDIAIGYLNVANAMYSPDSLVVKAKLDEEEDAYQIDTRYRGNPTRWTEWKGHYLFTFRYGVLTGDNRKS